MAEYGILMRPELIRAYQEGRKTQTRRVVRWPIKSRSDGSKQRLFNKADVDEINELLSAPRRHPLCRVIAPHGLVGDRLWFKETWGTVGDYDHLPPSSVVGKTKWVYYYADSAWYLGSQKGRQWPGVRVVPPSRKRRSIHLPKAFSRYRPPVTSLRIEPLRDITPADCAAEGVVTDGLADDELPAFFAAAWDGINGKRAPWESNPWVWVYGFPRYEVGNG